jgi:hypothetical protein
MGKREGAGADLGAWERRRRGAWVSSAWGLRSTVAHGGGSTRSGAVHQCKRHRLDTRAVREQGKERG